MQSLRRTEGWYEGRPVAAGSTPYKAHLSQIERFDKTSIARTGVALVNEIIEAFGQ
jgi:hypothetical protein